MQLYAYMHPMESIMHLRTALPLLALVGSLSACTVLPPLPPEPNYGYHPHPAPAVIYVPQPAVVQVYERPQLHRVYPRMPLEDGNTMRTSMASAGPSTRSVPATSTTGRGDGG